jgi:uncharacterized protein YndB with AHSA1/START domain
MSASNQSNEIKITRIYDAPLAAVWDAWTDPEQVAKWWGPRGFTLTTHSKVLKAGGHWHYTMHGPDGTDYPNKTIYLEVDHHKRLVYDHGANDDRPPLFRVDVSFTESDGKTQMDMTMTCPTPEEAEQTRKIIRDAGGNSTWDRLAEYLQKEISNQEVFVISRSFDAPVERVYEAWIRPEQFSSWLGPTGSSMEFIESDIKVGKTTVYRMNYDSGLTMYGKMTYIRIDRPDYLEYSQIFCDEKGDLSKHPLVPVWPDTMLTRVFFASEGSDASRVTVVWQPHGETSKEEIDAFAQMRGGMTQGWTQSFDKLEGIL